MTMVCRICKSNANVFAQCTIFDIKKKQYKCIFISIVINELRELTNFRFTRLVHYIVTINLDIKTTRLPNYNSIGVYRLFLLECLTRRFPSYNKGVFQAFIFLSITFRGHLFWVFNSLMHFSTRRFSMFSKIPILPVVDTFSTVYYHDNIFILCVHATYLSGRVSREFCMSPIDHALFYSRGLQVVLRPTTTRRERCDLI